MNNNSSSNHWQIEEVLLNKDFCLAEDILFREVENEAILLHVPSGTYYSLSETSILFWQALQNKQPFKPVIEQMVEEYNVEYSKVLQDLQVFLQDLFEAGILHKPLDI